MTLSNKTIQNLSIALTPLIDNFTEDELQTLDTFMWKCKSLTN